MAVRELSKELQQKAIDELSEDPKRIQSDLKYIKEWLSKQPHITARTDDQFLISFLRGCKYSLERTKEKIDMYYTLRTVTPELFKNRDPLVPEIQEILSLGISLPLPRLTDPASPRYILIRLGLMDKKGVTIENVFKVYSMIQDISMLEDDNLAVAGLILLQDLTNFSMSYALTLSPTLVKKATMCFQHGNATRIKGLNPFNVSSGFAILYKLFTPFLTEKLKQRVIVHMSRDEFLQHVPISILPEEYGGNGGKIDEIVTYWKNKVESYRDWFLEADKYGTDEKKRPGKPKTSESIFGIDGSFRQLSVD